MRYTQPCILKTESAAKAIQTGANPPHAKLSTKPDFMNKTILNSTSGAYESDE